MNALFPLLVLLLAWWAATLAAQESDLIDTRDFAGRAVSFETENSDFFALDHLAQAGDVNGDGVSDIGLVHVTDDPAYSFEIYLIFGSSQWTGRNTIRPALGGSVRFGLSDLEATGVGDAYILNIGDLNRDGYSEFAFSLASYRPLSNGGIRGVLFIVHGDSEFDHSGAFVEDIAGEIPGTTIFSTHPTRQATGFSGGCNMDIDGDGGSDLVIGGINESAQSTSGVVHVLLETTDLGPTVDLNDIGGALSGFTLGTPGVPMALVDGGDFDGDGFHDLLVAEQSLASEGERAVYLFFGRRDPRGHYSLRSLSDEGDGVLRFWVIDQSGDEGNLIFAGPEQVAGAGDLNGDGFDDILVGEAYRDFGLADSKVHLLYGGARLASPLLIDEVPAERRRVFHSLGDTHGLDAFGKSVASPGDLNGDGIQDILIGAPRRTDRFDRAGEAYLLYGRRDFPGDLYLAEGFDGIRIVGDTALGGLGQFTGAAGDFNADGNSDFLLGEPHLSSAVPGSSKAFVVFGTGNGRPPLTVVSVEPRSGFVGGGTRVRIKGSGFDDAALVRFGADAARVLVRVSPSELVVESPRAAEPGEVIITVTVGVTMRAAREPFVYVPDRPEVDLRNPGRWGLRVDGVPGQVVGLGLDFADFDGDGIDDLLIGSDLITDWVVTVVRGGRSLSGVTEAFTPGPGKCLIFKRTSVARSFFNVRVRNVGDVNADGIADMAVAAFLESSYIVFGRRGIPEELDFEAEVEAGRAVRLLFNSADSLGDFAPAGDPTGDGVVDLAISLSGEGVLLVEGRREWPSELDLRDDDEGSIFSRLITGPGAGSFAQVGDVNADGHPDFLVNGSSGSLRTPVYLLYGGRAFVDLPQSAAVEDYILNGGGVLFEWEGRVTNTGFVSANVSGVGDVNGDGIADLLIGDEKGGNGGNFDGMTYLIHGRRKFPARITFPVGYGPIDVEGVVRIGSAEVKQSSRALGATGDYNGDGFPDFIIGSQDLQVFPPGRVDVIFGSPDLPQVLDLANLGRHGFQIEGIHRITVLANSSHTPGDLNADGAPDFAFSEYSTPFFPQEEGGLAPGSVHVVFGLPSSVPFIRGDADEDRVLNITDAVFTLSYLFLGGVDPRCEDAADVDDRGTIGLTDAVYLLNHLFLGGPAPPPPYPLPGDDLTEDPLGCRGF